MASKKKFKTFTSGHGRLKLTPDRNDNEQYINWFPGHMNKAIKQIKAKLKTIDIILEIRDARLPKTCSNKAIQEAIGNKLKLIIFNKSNLADPSVTNQWKKFLNENLVSNLFVNALDKSTSKIILKKVKEIVEENYFQENPNGEIKKVISMMVIGLPNTGKSTLINTISLRSAAKTANKPGHTQTQQWIKINENYQLLDTPGIMPPKIENYEDGLKLCAIYAIPSKIVPDETTATFLIEYLKQHYPLLIQELYQFDPLKFNTIECLEQIGKFRNTLIKNSEIDYERVYKILLTDFREGKLGQISLEFPPQ